MEVTFLDYAAPPVPAPRLVFIPVTRCPNCGDDLILASPLPANPPTGKAA